METDRDCFLELLLRHQTEIKAFIGSILRDRHARDDVFQEVAMILWRQFDTFDRNLSFAGWARGIAAHKVLHEIRQSNRVPTLLEPQAMEAVLSAFERIASQTDERKDALHECLKLLPESARRLLTLKYEQHLDAEEIGRHVSKTADAVYQSLSRIRFKLADCVRNRLDLAGEAE